MTDRTLRLPILTMTSLLLLYGSQSIAAPVCIDPGSDSDGDGWGWENQRSCKVVQSVQTPLPTCSSNATDVDSNGYGWDNNRSCQVDTSKQNQNTHPDCGADAIDPDGDGWGWENGASCKVTQTPATLPTCSDSAIDPDGDGWGWENNASCKMSAAVVVTPDAVPICSANTNDPEGDGWGWENEASCKIAVVETPPGCSANVRDPDGDGLGFENNQVCVIPPILVKEQNNVGVIYSQTFTSAQLGLYQADALNDEWNQPLWHLGFEEGRVNIVSDPTNGKAMRVTFPAGAYGANGASAFLSDVEFGMGLPKSYDELYVSYDLKFDQNFDFVLGGKLPGLCGANSSNAPTAGCNTGGGYPSGYDGWSARGMWRIDGALENYVYHSAQSSYYGDDKHWQVKAQRGQWHRVQHRVVMNTVGYKNGILEAWIDGIKVLSINNLEYRKTSDIGINLFYFSTFFGGADSNWAPRTDQHMMFDNFVISTQPIPDAP